MIFRSRKLLNYAKEYPCIRCGADMGTVVPAHYSGWASHQLGKGTGIKCHDSAVAFLCHDCHGYFDSYESGNTDERAAEFLLLIVRQTAQLLIDGKLKVQ